MKPEWGVMSLFITDYLQGALKTDASARTPMTAQEFTPFEIMAGLNYAVYQKGEYDFGTYRK